jgi:hypothetical protein
MNVNDVSDHPNQEEANAFFSLHDTDDAIKKRYTTDNINIFVLHNIYRHIYDISISMKISFFM